MKSTEGFSVSYACCGRNLRLSVDCALASHLILDFLILFPYGKGEAVWGRGRSSNSSSQSILLDISKGRQGAASYASLPLSGSCRNMGILCGLPSVSVQNAQGQLVARLRCRATSTSDTWLRVEVPQLICWLNK